MRSSPFAICLALLTLVSGTLSAQSATIAGVITDEAGGRLPGAIVELRSRQGDRRTGADARGRYQFDNVPTGPVDVLVTLANFASGRRRVDAPGSGSLQVDIVLALALSADVTVTGKSTFTNLADVENPLASLVGIAQSASQGAITARQLEARPIMRAGEVLETVPGLVISQHSGEGKANQYYLRGFNLDHGTDFATTVAGMPVNMPTHGARPRLLGSELPDSRARQRRAVLARARTSPIRATSRRRRRQHQLREARSRRSCASAAATGWWPGARGRLAAAWDGHLLAAARAGAQRRSLGRPDEYRKVNGVLRYSRGDARNGVLGHGHGLSRQWDSTDQIPAARRGERCPLALRHDRPDQRR